VDGQAEERLQRLKREREEVEGLLAATARMAHVKLVRPLTQPALLKAELGLPDQIDAITFDLDGVLAASDEVHFDAWADALDTFLTEHFVSASVHLAHLQRLSRRTDYEEHLRGKPRVEGVRAFLASRGLTLPEGTPDDPPDSATVHGLANRKDEALHRRLEHEGVSAYEASVRYLEAAAAAGLPCAVVSASAHTAAILDRAGIADLIDVRVDGEIMLSARLRPRPAPDALLAACAELGVQPAAAAAFETTESGVLAARSAGFAFVAGVTRTGRGAVLGAAGADVVVDDLGELVERSLRGPRG
jgi:HAD superfamily hydrolase (TIGR01509 family)